jgi:hypothetical protein
MAGITEDRAEAAVDYGIRRCRSSSIEYVPYVPGAVDVYRQKDKVYGVPVPLVGRAIVSPTPELITVIGNNEKWDVAFLFSRVEMVSQFPLADEGEWMDTSGEMTWDGKRFKIGRAAPSGQIGEKFLLFIVLGTTIEGQRGT